MQKLKALSELQGFNSITEMINSMLDDLVSGMNYDSTIKRIHLELEPVIENQKNLNESIEELIKQNILSQQHLAESLNQQNKNIALLIQILLTDTENLEL